MIDFPASPTIGQVFTAAGVSWRWDGTKWVPNSSSDFSTGDVKMTIKTTADAGWVMMDDGTLGDASSGGTTRANADTVNLFTLLWTNTAQGDCPVSGGRGASAAADFAAHKTISLPKALGRALAVAGLGSGLTTRAVGAIFGEENHTLTVTEMPVHNHTVNDPTHTHPLNALGNIGAFANMTFSGPSSVTGGTMSAAATGISINNSGGGAGHNVIQPTTFLKVMMKL